MEVTFKYKGQIISTPKLEKKLKRMGISLEDIEIIDTPKKEIITDNSKEFQTLKFKSKKDNFTHITFWPINKPIPTLYELCKERGLIWNPELKIGLKEFTNDYINTLYYVE